MANDMVLDRITAVNPELKTTPKTDSGMTQPGM